MATEDTVPHPVPEPVRAFAEGMLGNDRFSYTFEGEEIEVPSRFDGPAETATWRFDGTVRVSVSTPDVPEG